MYNKRTGQGIYVLIDPKSGAVKYVGRGDVHARLARHAQDPGRRGYKTVILRDNDLTKAQAKGLENVIIGRFGGAKSVNPLTNLHNAIRSFSPLNKNSTLYKQSTPNTILDEAMKAINAARRRL